MVRAAEHHSNPDDPEAAIAALMLSQQEIAAVERLTASKGRRLHVQIPVPAARRLPAAKLVVEVLDGAQDPLSVAEVVRAIEERFDARLSLMTVRSVLQEGQLARDGRFVKEPGGRYGRYRLR